jgi:two-component system chemotaxis sensor kinase CheA
VVLGNNKFKDLFCEEATDQLTTLSGELLNIEKDPTNIERYATLMRAAHTVKGAAATMGYTGMAKLAHALEDVFHLGERKAIVLDAEAVSVSLSAIDTMRASLAEIKEHDKEIDVEQVIQNLLALTSREQSASSAIAENAPVHPTPVPAQAFASALPSSVRVDVERLDALMGLFEEMLMLRLKLDSLLEPAIGITKTITDHQVKDRLYFLKEFETIFAQLARLLSETQGQLLTIRLVQVEMIFSQFPRMVRDLSLREDN